MCAWGNTVTLTPPERSLTPNRIRNSWVKVDECLATAVTSLWYFGYATLGSCCGHGKDRGEIVVDD